MSTPTSTGRVRTTYAFIKGHSRQFSVQALCRVLDVAPSGYYERLKSRSPGAPRRTHACSG